MKEELEIKYGSITTITLVVGTVIGIGIFLRANQLALLSGGNNYAVVTAWIVAACMIIPLAIIISEAASMFTNSGGIQVYAEAVWSKRFGFGVGVSQTFFYLPITSAFISYLIANYTFTILNMHVNTIYIILLAMFYVVGFFIINITSTKISSSLQVVSTIIKIIPLVLIGIGGCLYAGDTINTVGTSIDINNTFIENSHHSFFTQVASVLLVSLFSFEGWIFVCVVSKEIKNPSRNIPLAIIGGLILIVILYVFFTAGLFNVANAQSLATNGSSTVDIAAKLFGKTFGAILNIFVLISALGVANSFSLALVRGPYALAKSRSFPGSAWLCKVSKRNNLPVNSGMFGSFVVLFYLSIPLLLKIQDPISILSAMSDSSILLFFFYYAVVSIGIVKMRKTHPELNRPFKAPFIHLLLIIGMIGATYAIYGLASAYINSLPLVLTVLICACSGFWLFSFTRK